MRGIGIAGSKGVPVPGLLFSGYGKGSDARGRLLDVEVGGRRSGAVFRLIASAYLCGLSAGGDGVAREIRRSGGGSRRPGRAVVATVLDASVRGSSGIGRAGYADEAYGLVRPRSRSGGDARNSRRFVIPAPAALAVGGTDGSADFRLAFRFPGAHSVRRTIEKQGLVRSRNAFIRRIPDNLSGARILTIVPTVPGGLRNRGRRRELDDFERVGIGATGS